MRLDLEPEYYYKAVPVLTSHVYRLANLVNKSKHVLLPEANFRDFKGPDPFIPRVRGHHEEWIEACKTGKRTASNFDYAGALTEANHLGNLAYRLGKKLEWDPVNLRAKNCPEADRLISKEYRKGWML